MVSGWRSHRRCDWCGQPARKPELIAVWVRGTRVEIHPGEVEDFNREVIAAHNENREIRRPAVRVVEER